MVMRPETPLTPSKGYCVACEREFWQMEAGPLLCERCAPVVTTTSAEPDWRLAALNLRTERDAAHQEVAGFWDGWEFVRARAHEASEIAREVEMRCHALGHANPCWTCSPILDIIHSRHTGIVE